MNEHLKCLFCHAINDQEKNKGDKCTNCGMPLTDHHSGGKRRVLLFIKAFIAIVFFCALMMFYLPR